MKNGIIKILFVEDDEDYFFLIRDMLSEIDYVNFELEQISSYNAALEAIQEKRYDVALFDSQFSKTSGLDLLCEDDKNGCETPIIFFSEGRDPEFDNKAIQNGAADCLIKDQIDKMLLDRSIHFAIERKQSENALRKARDLAEAANSAKSQSLANLSHEIRTQLNGIMGMIELAELTKLTVEQHKYLKITKSSAKSLLFLINDILDFSKIEAGKLDLNNLDFNLHDSVQEIVSSMLIKAKQKNLEIVCRIAEEVPIMLNGDPGRLRQIIVNLIANAVKFTEEGKVVVEVEKKWQKNGEMCLHFSVSDSGIGISKEKQKQIFEAFTQVDNSITRKNDGTGLGLAICSQLVKMMNGKIWVESPVNIQITDKKNPGSTFHFTTCFRLSKKLFGVGKIPQMSELKGLNILVVDNNSTNRFLLKKLLTHWQLKPTLVESGKKAIEALEKATYTAHPFSLVLSDAKMPEVDGFELTKRIKQNPKTSHIPVLIITSIGKPGDGLLCQKLGVAGYLLKPIDPKELRQAILTIFGDVKHKRRQSNLVTRHSIRERHKSHRILLVEDNLINQTLTIRLLEKMGHDVVVANNGKEAVKTVEDNRFDAILMDVQMPVMNGIESTILIRKKEKETGLHVPIIALTALAIKGDKEKCLAAGMDEYVLKPIKFDELLATIEKATEPI